MSSSSRSNQRQISSILCLSDFLKVGFGLISRKNPMLASCLELCFSISGMRGSYGGFQLFRWWIYILSHTLVDEL